MKMTEEVKAERREARKQAKRAEAKRLLIAAAPELLEACKLAVERIEINNCEGSENYYIQEIKKVIQKAEAGI